MKTEKAPAFQFYAKDWLADGRVISMSLEERGAYIHLMAVYWNDGGLPDDPAALADVLGVSVRTFERLWKKVGRCFDSDGKALTQKRLEKEKSKQAQYKTLQSEKGQKSAKSRVSAKDAQPRLIPVETEKEPKVNSPFPSPFPSPTPVLTQQQQQQAAREAARPSSPSVGSWIDYDPKSDLQRAVVSRVEGLTPGGTDEERRDLLRTLSMTPDEGAVLEGSLRQASSRWLAMTIATAARFEREQAEVDDPPPAMPPEVQSRIDAHLAMRRAEGRLQLPE